MLAPPCKMKHLIYLVDKKKIFINNTYRHLIQDMYRTLMKGMMINSIRLQVKVTLNNSCNENALCNNTTAQYKYNVMYRNQVQYFLYQIL